MKSAGGVDLKATLLPRYASKPSPVRGPEPLAPEPELD
jgi:hypothetical protein